MEIHQQSNAKTGHLMQSCGKNVVRNMEISKWVRCPVCQGKTRVKVYKETVLLQFPLYCPKCRKETMISLIDLKMIVLQEPDV